MLLQPFVVRQRSATVIQEKIENRQHADPRRRRRIAGEYPKPDNARHPIRILPLAIAAVALSCTTAAFASGLLSEASGERYAFEVIGDLLNKRSA